MSSQQYNFTWPVESWKRISSYFGYRDITGLPQGSTAYHDAIDIAANAGTNVLAAYSGTITYTGYNKYRGNYITIAHDNGVSTEYAHLQDIVAKVGDTVAAGAVIGHVGSTGASSGPHLDFKIKENGKAVDPLTFGDIGSSSGSSTADKISDAVTDIAGTVSDAVGGKVSMDNFLQAIKLHWLLVAAGLLIVAVITK